MKTKKSKPKLPSWNLTDLYPAMNSPELANALKLFELEARNFSSLYEGKTIELTAQALAEAIVKYEQISDLSGRIASYAYLAFSTAVNDTKVTSFYQNTTEKLTDISSHLVFFPLELNRISDKNLKDKLKDKKLSRYAPWLRDVRAQRPHELSPELEKFEHETDIAASSWVRLFDETIAALRFPYNGKKLTEAQIFELYTDKNRTTRKKAASSIAKVLGENARLFALITNTLAKDKEIKDKWHKFPRPISSRNLSNLIEDEVVDTLISTVRKNYKDLSHRYYSLKAKWLKLGKLEFWDRNAPLPFDDTRKIPWDKAVSTVLGAYRRFSPRLAEEGEKFFKNPWIDAGIYPGKMSGAFAHPTVPSSHPYLLVNYHGRTRDVMTLAHELGHGVHQLLSAAQGALMADTPLTLAETASVFGEQLVFRAMLEAETNPKRRKAMIAQKIEDMLSTVVRQTAFCEFEREVHDARRKGELTPERIGQIWMKTQKESLGPAFNLRPEYRHFWSYIPHFIHSPFYVYAYAFGDCLVNSLYSVYLSGMPGFEQKYLEMLKSGGSKRYNDLLAPFGLSASKPDFWQKGLKVIENLIDEVERLDRRG